MHFQRCEHLAELPACKVIGQLHDQAVGLFDGSKKCVAHRCFLLTCSFLSNIACRALEQVFAQRRVISQARSARERYLRFVAPVENLQQMSARRPKGLVVGNSAGRNFFKRGESRCRLPRLRQRNGPADQRTDARPDLHQAFIKQDDLGPLDPSAVAPGWREWIEWLLPIDSVPSV